MRDNNYYAGHSSACRAGQAKFNINCAMRINNPHAYVRTADKHSHDVLIVVHWLSHIARPASARGFTNGYIYTSTRDGLAAHH